MDFQQFQHSHGAQLANIPGHYWRALYEKLQFEVYDAGKYFTMKCDSDGNWQVVVSSEEDISPEESSCICLVDHAWTFQSKWAQRQLEVISGLAERIGGLMGLIEASKQEAAASDSDTYDADSESGNEKEEWSDSDEGAEGDEEKSSEDAHQEINFELKEDSYDSGDLGDVSVAYVTDAPDKSQEGASKSRSVHKKKRKVRRGTDAVSDDEDEEEEKDRAVTRKLCQLKDEKGETSEMIVTLPNQKLVQDILTGKWKYCHAYHISNSVVPMWYIMDEFGSRINHSTSPTMAMQCFFYIPTQLAYSVIWPLKKLSKGDMVTCNYLPEAVQPGLGQVCHSIPWTAECNMLKLDDPLWKDLDQFSTPNLDERGNEAVPNVVPPSPAPMLNYSVYTDMKLVQSHLQHPSFHIVSSRENADILWLSDHFKDFKCLKPEQMVNQFPCECVLTCKDLLASVAVRANGGVPPQWLPLTFNLLYELPKLVHEYLRRKENGEDNLWIIKPWNLGRSLDIHITDNLTQIVRLAQVGPKVGCKYITNPVLFHRPELGLVKFDYRYMILLRSVKPLEVYVYDIFWLRFANKPFDLEKRNLNEYEVHFTVMNYDSQTKLKQIHYNDFIPLFEEQYPSCKWATIEDKTIQLLKDLLVSAASSDPPGGICNFGQSRAIYAADLMLEKVSSDSETNTEFQPRLLEINFSPDCVRACKYHPEFYNHMFLVLFMGVTEGIPVRRII